jgi:hypothetical protein
MGRDRNGVIVYKWRIVLGGLAAASFLGTFAAGPAFASTVSSPVSAQSSVGQLVPGAVSALNSVTSLPAVTAVTKPVSSLLSNLSQSLPAAAPVNGTPVVAPATGVVPALADVTGALLAGVGSVVGNLSDALLPAVGPAVSGLTAPVNGISQDLGNLSGLPVIGTLIGSLPALPDAGTLLNDLNGIVNGVGTHAAG